MPLKSCETCKAEFKPKHRNSRFCSRPCLWKNNGKDQAKKPFVWWTNAKGYIEGRVTVNGVTRRMKYHRWVMEQELGHKLPSHVDVHHLDGNKANNDPANLQVIDHGRHTMTTHTGRKRGGWKLNLNAEERLARSNRAKRLNLGNLGRAAIAEVEG